MTSSSVDTYNHKLEECYATALPRMDVARDVDSVIQSFRLHMTRRYFHQRFWREETLNAEYAERSDPLPRLESVSEHSWHVADTVMILGAHFPCLDVGHCVQLAILHDKLEMFTSDISPIGLDGTGNKTHAFNGVKRQSKAQREKEALTRYLGILRPSIRDLQRALFMEVIDRATVNSQFVAAVDKFQALAYVLLKKRGLFEDRHLLFTLNYSQTATSAFPPITQHYAELRMRLLRQVARRRGVSVAALLVTIGAESEQLSFWDEQ